MVPPSSLLATIRISSTSEENAHGTEACLQKRSSGCRGAKCLAFRVSGSGRGSLGSGAFMGLDFFIGLRPLYVFWALGGSAL